MGGKIGSWTRWAAAGIALGLLVPATPSSSDDEQAKPPPWPTRKPSEPPWSADRGASSEVETAVEVDTASPESVPVEIHAASDLDSSRFSADRAWQDMVSLVGFGPRVTGSEGAEQARAYIRGELEAMGAEVIERRLEISGPDGEPLEAVHLTGVLAGASDDIFMLAAPYDTFPFESFEHVGANSGASGPAVVLELGRVFAVRSRPYTIWLTFMDGDALPATAGETVSARSGSRSLAAAMAEDETLSRIRVAFFFDQVADRDLTIARDLRSHRPYRELAWTSAHAIGHGEAFPASGGFESPDASHRAFLSQNLRRVVAIVDSRYGGDEPPGLYWHSEDDTLEHCSADSLAIVGTVSMETLQRIEERLSKIDRFVNPPAAPGSE